MNRLLSCCAILLALVLALPVVMLPLVASAADGTAVLSAEIPAAKPVESPLAKTSPAISASASAYPLLASIRPIALLARELGDGLPLQVDTLLPSGTSTHDFALSPSDLARVRGARLVLWLGPAGEPYLAKVMASQRNDLRWEELPGVTRLPFRSALHDEDEHEDEHADAEHDPDEHQHDAQDHDHHHTGTDPHLWWSTANAIQLARALAQRISTDRPDWAPRLQQNLQALEQRLEQQRTEQRQRLATGAKPFLLAHDAFFYLEEDLGIHSEAALMLDPENRPGLQHLVELKQRVARQQIACVLTGALVPASLIDKIDTQPPLLRVSVDELGWDFNGERYSEWLALTYGKIAECVLRSSG